MTADDALAVYLREQWGVLLRYVAVLRVDPEGAEAVLTRTVTRIAAGARARRLPTGDALDHYVRRRLVKACIADGRRRSAQPTTQQQVHVRYVNDRAGVPDLDAVDPVRDAVAELPAASRVALVLRYYDGGVDDATAAGLVGCTAGQQREHLAKGLQSLVNVLAVDRAGTVTGDGSSRTEGLLRAMLDQSPTPSATSDPMAVVPRRVHRLLRQRFAVAAAAIAVVAVAVVAALPQGSSSTPTAPRTRSASMATAQPVALPRLPYAYPSAVVAAGGYLWTVELHPSSKHPGTFIERRNPVTGRTEETYHVPDEDFTIAYGLGRVWTWGGGGQFGDHTIISELDPSTGAIRSAPLVPPADIAEVAFAAGRAWFTEPRRGRVISVDPHHLTHMTSIRIAGARDVVPVSAASVVVSGTTGPLRELPSKAPVRLPPPSPTKLAAAPAYGVWIARGRLLTYQPSIAAAPTKTLHLPYDVTGVLGDPQHGVYVALTGSKVPLDAPYLIYFSPDALLGGSPRPTAMLNGHVGVSSIAPGPGGTVVFVTDDGGIWAWTPLHHMAGGDRSFAATSALR